MDNIYIYNITESAQSYLKVFDSKDEANKYISSKKDCTGKVLYRIEPLRVILPNLKERIRIRLFCQNKEQAICTLICNPLEVEKELLSLREYGTGFMRKEIISIRHLIDKHYRLIPYKEAKNLEDTEQPYYKGLDLEADLNEIIDALNDAAIEHDEPTNEKKTYDYFTGNFCDIPVNDCKAILADTPFRVYNFKDIKGELYKRRLIVTSANRTDYTAHHLDKNGKTEHFKALRFYVKDKKILKSHEDK